MAEDTGKFWIDDLCPWDNSFSLPLKIHRITYNVEIKYLKFCFSISIILHPWTMAFVRDCSQDDDEVNIQENVRLDGCVWLTAIYHFNTSLNNRVTIIGLYDSHYRILKLYWHKLYGQSNWYNTCMTHEHYLTKRTVQNMQTYKCLQVTGN